MIDGVKSHGSISLPRDELSENRSENQKSEGRARASLPVSENFPQEIGLSDLILFLWKLRLYLLTGLVVGTFVGLVAPGRLIPLRYHTVFQIETVAQESPAISTASIIVEKMNSQLSTPSAMNTFHEAFVERLPEYQQKMNQNPAALQNAWSTMDAVMPEDLPVHLQTTMSESSFRLVMKLPFQSGNRSELQEAALQAVNKIVNQVNSREVAQLSLKKKHLLSQKTGQRDSVFRVIETDGASARKRFQQVAIQAEQFHLENLRRAERLPANKEKALEKSIVVESEIKSEENSSIFDPALPMFHRAAKNLSQSLTIASFLSQENLIEQEELDAFIAEHQSLQFQLSKSFAEINSQARMAEIVGGGLSNAITQAHAPISGEDHFLPPFVSLSSTNQLRPTNNFETPSPRPAVLILGSVFLFVLIGAVFGLVSFFFRKVMWRG